MSVGADALPAAEAPADKRLEQLLLQRLQQGLDALAASPALLLAASVTVNALLLPYRGLYHDAILYGVQTLNRTDDGRFAQDLYLHFGSQDRYSTFSFLAAGWVRAFGLPLAFFLLYLVSNTAFLWAVQRLVFALVPVGRLAALGTLAVAGLSIQFGGFGVFHANESFLTPRILANALVLFALERLLRGRMLTCFVLLTVGLLVHPLMAFGGVLTALVWCGLRWLSPRWLCALALAAAMGLTGLLEDRPLATRLLGPMDGDWYEEVLAVNFYNFPSQWLMVDWLRIGSAAVMVLLARAYLPAEAQAARRLLAVVVGVAVLGVTGSVVAYRLPYALPMQGQPYRVLWLVQLLEVPLGIFVVGHWWGSRKTWARMVAAAWILSWTLVWNPFALGLALLCFALIVPAIRGLGKAPRSANWLFTSFALSGLAVLVLERFSRREFFDPWIQLLSVGLVVYFCSWSGGIKQLIALATAGVVLAILGAADLYGVTTKEHETSAWLKQYLTEHHEAPQTPTVYWPAGAKALWFDVGVNCYFDWYQLAGNLFSRDNALEGRRRKRLVACFEMARLRQEIESPDPITKFFLERRFGASWDTEAPSENELRRLCAEPDVDYLVLRQQFDHLYTATDGHWYLYDCHRVRSESSLIKGAGGAGNVQSAE